MISTNFIPLNAFCNMFDINVDTIEVAKATKRLPPVMFAKDRKSLFVDYKYVAKRVEFRKKMWLMAHELYYKLMELFPTQSALSRIMAKMDGNYSSSDVWNAWMTYDLFMTIDDNRLMLEPRHRDYKFVRFARWLLAIHNRTGLDLNTIKVEK